MAEGAAVVGLAAVLAGKAPRPKGPVGTIVTGRNPDMAVFTRLVAGGDVTLGDLTVKGKTHAA